MTQNGGNNERTGHGGPHRLSLTCSVEIYERLAAGVVVQTLAAVLLQLDLFDLYAFSDHLAPLLPAEEAVRQHAVYRNWPSLLSDLVSGLEGQTAADHQSMFEATVSLVRCRG